MPKKSPMVKRMYFVPKPMYDWLRARAEKVGTSASEVLRQIVGEKMKSESRRAL